MKHLEDISFRLKKISFFVLFPILAILQSNVITASNYGYADDILGCGGFLKSDIELNFSRVEVKLYTKQGSLKYKSDCAPNNGYYFLPLYDTGEYVLKIEPPVGWSFEPREVELYIDGKSDPCSLAQDINFVFKGFAVIGKVGSEGIVGSGGPAGVRVALMTSDGSSVLQEKETEPGGGFMFSPVAPGNYLLSASHPKWKLSRPRAPVSVIGDNGDSGSALAVAGYEVKGQILAGGEPVPGVILTIHHLSVPSDSTSSTISDAQGVFSFNSVSPGHYRIAPQRGEDDIRLDIRPLAMDVEVLHGDFKIPANFEVRGFAVSGRVLSAPDVGVEGVMVLVDGVEAANTDANGYYKLEDIQAGIHSLAFHSEDFNFPVVKARIAPDLPRLPVVYADKFRVCGHISGDGLPPGTSASGRKVVIEQGQEGGKWGPKVEVMTDTEGCYCSLLPAGSYRVRAESTTEELYTLGLRFTPDPAVFEITDHPISNGPTFTRVRCSLSGRLFCLPLTSCPDVLVSIKPIRGHLSSHDFPSNVFARRGIYTFEGLAPGEYEVTVSGDGYRCWEKETHIVRLDSARTWAPPFRQTGFYATIESSHPTEVIVYPNGGVSQGTMKISAGAWKLCLPSVGPYDLEAVGTSCHGFKPSRIRWEVGTTISLKATSHMVGGIILSEDAVDDLFIEIEPAAADGKSRLGPLVPSKEIGLSGTPTFSYTFSLRANEGEVVSLRPWARELLFDPVEQLIEVGGDCKPDAAKFTARRGIVLSGGTSPPVSGVKISVFQEQVDEAVSTALTDSDGVFSVGPLGEEGPFSVLASKEGYILTPISGRDHWFDARRLAEVLVEVVAESTPEDGKTIPLPGVLLSLSGGERYRRNSMTGVDGRLTFGSLSPSEYFLRPMMKEYSFEPPSEMVKVAEGATVEVRIVGHRVAFSCYGIVTSPCGEPEAGVVVEAVSVCGETRCCNLQEEAVSERSGHFRIRGLLPQCTYEIQMKKGVQINEDFERVTPAGTNITILSGDVKGPRLVAFRHHRTHRTDVSLRIYTTDPLVLSDLRVSVMRQDGTETLSDDAEDISDSPSRVVHVMGLERWASGGNTAGALVLFPPLISDGRLHSLCLETIHGNAAILRAMLPRSTLSFRADSFHKHFVIRYEPGVRDEGVVGVGARVGGGGGDGPTLPLAVPLLVLMAMGIAHWRRLKVDVDGGGSNNTESIRGTRIMDAMIANEERLQNRKKSKPRKT